MSEHYLVGSLDNYLKEYETFDTKLYLSKYIEIISEFMLHISENLHVQDDNYFIFLVKRGVETIVHCFKNLLMYTKNIDLVVFQCKKALYYYIEFIGQISDVSIHHSYLQLNSKDATLFVYKKTIYEINNDHKKNFVITEKERLLLDNVSTSIDLFNLIVFNILRKEKLKYEKKESIIHFSMEKSTSILEKLFSNIKFSSTKLKICIFMFEQFNLHDITTIKYSQLCEVFVKKIKKYSENQIEDVKKTIENKIYSRDTFDKINKLSELKFMNWLLSP